MVIIDDRLLDASSEAQIIENFNRTLTMMDTLAGVVADIQDSALFKITFDSDGGSAVPNQYVIEGEKAEQPSNPTKSSYAFKGWYDGDELFDFDTPITKHYNLTAHWTRVYEVTFDTDDGVPSSYDTQYIEDGNAIDLTGHTPTKSGYEFIGWYDSETGTSYVEGMAVHKDYSLVAHYIKFYTITYDANGGEPEREPLVVAEGDLAPNPPVERDGYTFDGWYDGQDLFDFEHTLVYKDYTLTAHWTQL